MRQGGGFNGGFKVDGVQRSKDAHLIGPRARGGLFGIY